MANSLTHLHQPSLMTIYPATSTHRRSRVFQPTKSRYVGNRLTCSVFIFLLAVFITSARYLPQTAYAVPRPPANTSKKSSATPPLAPGIQYLQVRMNTTNTQALHTSKPPRTTSASKAFNPSNFPARKDSKLQLETPAECSLWRSLARKPTQLKLYKKHFNNHDDTDWFLYAAIFGERWHMQQKSRPAYLDIAANHAKRWSITWFFDRCMGWDGVCAEPNNAYWKELSTERQCRLINTCLSDRVRKVNFSYTAAYGGVVADLNSGQRMGVDGSLHAHSSKYGQHFKGISEINCSTMAKEMTKRDGNGVSHFDFMSLDVEGHEFPILQGIDWNRTKIDVIVTENRRPDVRQYLTDLGYTHFPGVLKDDIWISPESGLQLDPMAVDWMSSFNKSEKTFGPGVVDDPEQFVVDDQSVDTAEEDGKPKTTPTVALIGAED